MYLFNYIYINIKFYNNIRNNINNIYNYYFKLNEK